MALRFLLRFPAFSQKEQNGPFFTFFPWRFQKFLTALPRCMVDLAFCRFVPGKSPGLGIGHRGCSEFPCKAQGLRRSFRAKSTVIAVPGVPSAPLPAGGTCAFRRAARTAWLGLNPMEVVGLNRGSRFIRPSPWDAAPPVTPPAALVPNLLLHSSSAAPRRPPPLLCGPAPLRALSPHIPPRPRSPDQLSCRSAVRCAT